VNLPPVSYKCGYCSQHVGSSTGYHSYDGRNGATPFHAYICGSCGGITMFDNAQRHWPEALSGNPVGDLPPTVDELYEEARACMSVRAYTAAVLACRKLLMNTAVSKGAPKNQNFTAYVDYLAIKGYIAPDARPWVDHIRDVGNEATHEITQTAPADAEELMVMTEALLKGVYELPARVNARISPSPQPTPPMDSNRLG
jgi:Domain of unknown function (DUF4145)